MHLTYVPLLKVQRELYSLPRGMERFREYLKTMTDAATGDLALPLVAMNPMGKDHVPALIDSYLALDAEAIASQAVNDVRPAAVAGVATPEYRVALVVSDDLGGGWTNRWASEYSHRIEAAAITKRGWLVGILWTSEPASAQHVRDAVLTSIYRAEYLQTHAAPRTLGDMLEQEGYAMARAGCTTPRLDDEDIAYTRSVIEPHRDAADRATIIACMFGDTAAKALGYPPRGLSHRAGLALALADTSTKVLAKR
ncbi:MAG TPA: hypothetical protein VFV51_15885 [Vicinamibacterales bacterium]|nr:hypothetical protein [Vicinamibacterales bacterium]